MVRCWPAGCPTAADCADADEGCRPDEGAATHGAGAGAGEGGGGLGRRQVLRPVLLEANSNPSFNIEHDTGADGQAAVVSHVDRRIKVRGGLHTARSR